MRHLFNAEDPADPIQVIGKHLPDFGGIGTGFAGSRLATTYKILIWRCMIDLKPTQRLLGSAFHNPRTLSLLAGHEPLPRLVEGTVLSESGVGLRLWAVFSRVER